MNADMIVWPGGEHPFRLALAQLEGLQQKTDCGPEWLAMKLRSGQWTATEAFEVLRWGLIGGGMGDAAAKKAVADAFDRHPVGAFKVPALTAIMTALYGSPDDGAKNTSLAAFKVPALTVIMAALYGPPDDAVGKPSLASGATPTGEIAESGSSAPSTASAALPDSVRERSAI